MFTLGGTELLLVGVLALLLFGPEKVPQLARTLGRIMREFNKYKDIMESTLRSEMQAAEAIDAAKAASDPDAERTDGTDKMKQAAAASREFAAEHGIEMPNASDLGIGVQTPGPDSAFAQPADRDVGVEAAEEPAAEGLEMAARVTDEDEEEG